MTENILKNLQELKTHPIVIDDDFIDMIKDEKNLLSIGLPISTKTNLDPKSEPLDLNLIEAKFGVMDDDFIDAIKDKVREEKGILSMDNPPSTKLVLTLENLKDHLDLNLLEANFGVIFKKFVKGDIKEFIEAHDKKKGIDFEHGFREFNLGKDDYEPLFEKLKQYIVANNAIKALSKSEVFEIFDKYEKERDENLIYTKGVEGFVDVISNKINGKMNDLSNNITKGYSS